METIRKILIGKLFGWSKWQRNIILGVEKHYTGNYLLILVGVVSKSKQSIKVLSWYCYDPKNMMFIGRSSKDITRKCVRTHPDKLHYHIGETIDISKCEIWEEHGDYYKEYLRSIK